MQDISFACIAHCKKYCEKGQSRACKYQGSFYKKGSWLDHWPPFDEGYVNDSSFEPNLEPQCFNNSLSAFMQLCFGPVSASPNEGSESLPQVTPVKLSHKAVGLALVVQSRSRLSRCWLGEFANSCGKSQQPCQISPEMQELHSCRLAPAIRGFFSGRFAPCAP